MPDVSTAIYHGIRQNLRRVLVALGPERVEKGMTAFEDGASNWSECFFARAFKGEAKLGYEDTGSYQRPIDPSVHICHLLNDRKLSMIVPVKMLWHTFDSVGGAHITRAELKEFIKQVMDEGTPTEVLQLLRSVNYEHVENRTYACATNNG